MEESMKIAVAKPGADGPGPSHQTTHRRRV